MQSLNRELGVKCRIDQTAATSIFLPCRECLSVPQNAPGDPRELVGQGSGELVLVHAHEIACCSQGPKLNFSQLCGRIRMTCAAWTNSVRKVFALPRLEMRPRIGLPPVEYWRGTSPSQAPKSRPRSKASPVPMAATMAVEIIGPMPGTLISRSGSCPRAD